MSALKTQDEGIIILSQEDYLPVLVESLLIDRKLQGLSPETIDSCARKLKRVFHLQRGFQNLRQFAAIRQHQSLPGPRRRHV